MKTNPVMTSSREKAIRILDTSSPRHERSFTQIVIKKTLVVLLSAEWDTRKPRDKSKRGSLSLQPMIALRSPYAFRETGLRVCPPEKRRDGHRFADEQSVLYSPVCL
jgi:hypothetical protein